MNLRAAATTFLAVVLAVTLGMGSASASTADPSPGPGPGPGHQNSQPTVPVPAAVVPAGDVDLLTGYPHEVHTDERMIDEELELTEAAPHTLGRFHAGSP